MNLSRSIRKQMKRFGCHKCFATGLRSVAPHGKLINSSDPMWVNAEFEEFIMIKPGAGPVPKEWVELR